ncbi:ScbA/BarX family gamma-butyrolactone biosynthesis protein [Actinoplanes sp. NEAU-A12]|uniref:ScbA/BarX family gamma-butyrolactone biosynthesis protein n=1 Tax=Actinoplanes sandaracinus TaxID=3045177 RepID=A0ABT6X0W3_9ACTN|nr:ScbA/BarX family gamma-butyrolactone biosynthesis protein [Actinoplanes sandaracinus]MDI6105618.1 ScbA/BarX family gamma-butyrolactone biosynthesis protein [Actinoplanes sandaracinus]
MSTATPTLNAKRPELSFNATIPRNLVHRASVCEVFLTDAVQVDADHFLCGGQLPRVHSFFSDQAGAPPRYDSLLLMEVARQASILVAHRFLGVPLDHKFTFISGGISVVDPQALVFGALPGELTVDLRIVGERLRDGERVGVEVILDMAVAGAPAATARTAFMWMTPQQWDAFRARGRAKRGIIGGDPLPLGPGADPAAVGRAAAQNVVIGPIVAGDQDFLAPVRVDLSHPCLFDHPLDHVPGMLVFEAFRQAAMASAGAHHGLAPANLVMSDCTADFVTFGEFEHPIMCHAEVGDVVDSAAAEAYPVVPVRLEMRQQDQTIARATIELSVHCHRVRRIGG